MSSHQTIGNANFQFMDRIEVSMEVSTLYWFNSYVSWDKNLEVRIRSTNPKKENTTGQIL